MKIFRTIWIITCFYLVFNGTSIFSQKSGESKVYTVSARTRGTKTNKKVEPGDYFPKNEIKSPFRYVVVDDDVRTDTSDNGKEQAPVDRFVRVLMEEQAFNKGNLIYLFNYLSNYYADPLGLDIEVHTSLVTLETLEESIAMSNHSSRDNFRQFHRTASYARSNNIYEKCNAGFLYDTGKPGNFVMRYVNLACPTKK